MTDELLDEIRGLLRTAERPILLHCRSGNRVGAVWMAYRILDEGADPAIAEEEAVKAGFKPGKLGETIRDYIRRRR